MVFQSVPNTAEIDMIFTLNDVACQNVFYAHEPTGYALADLAALAAAIDAQWQGTWRTDQPPEVLYLRTEVRGLESENDLIAIDATSTNPGIHASPALPNNVTLSIKKESGLTGRSARGRTYWIGIPQNQISAADENNIITAFADSLVVNVDSIRTAISGVGLWEPALVSRFAGGVQRDEGAIFPWVSTSIVNRRVDTQRGRLPV